MKIFKSAVYGSEKKVEKATRSGMYTVRNVRSGTNKYFQAPERASQKAESEPDHATKPEARK